MRILYYWVKIPALITCEYFLAGTSSVHKVKRIETSVQEILFRMGEYKSVVIQNTQFMSLWPFGAVSEFVNMSRTLVLCVNPPMMTFER